MTNVIFAQLHAIEEMTADRMSVDDVMNAILDVDGEVVEDYPGDPRGASCLVAGKIGDGYIHIVVSYGPMPVVITVYRLDEERWVDYKTRKR